MTFCGIWNCLQIQIRFQIACAKMPAARHTYFKLRHTKMTTFQMLNWKGVWARLPASDSSSNTLQTQIYHLRWQTRPLTSFFGLPPICHGENELKQFRPTMHVVPTVNDRKSQKYYLLCLWSCAMLFLGHFFVCFNICEPCFMILTIYLNENFISKTSNNVLHPLFLCYAFLRASFWVFQYMWAFFFFVIFTIYPIYPEGPRLFCTAGSWPPVKTCHPKWGNHWVGEKIKARWVLVWKLCFAIPFPLSLLWLLKIMTRIPSHQFWSDPATGISYTRIGGKSWWGMGCSSERVR